MTDKLAYVLTDETGFSIAVFESPKDALKYVRELYSPHHSQPRMTKDNKTIFIGKTIRTPWRKNRGSEITFYVEEAPYIGYN